MSVIHSLMSLPCIDASVYRSEGYLCLPCGPSCYESGSSQYLTEQLSGVFSGEYSEIQRQRIRVTLGSRRLPVLALNEVFIGERDISQ